MGHTGRTEQNQRADVILQKVGHQHQRVARDSHVLGVVDEVVLSPQLLDQRERPFSVGE